MNGLTPLIDLATQRSLDLFFRVGQGYLARSDRDAAQKQPGWGLSPIGVQSRAEARIVVTLGHKPRDGVLHAWPGGNPKTRQPM
ncbi:hypothetical protein [Mesorhizobium sp. CAU 1732]|uniref:hypothetical protein n=1 Tax=Mesorhizobium sp. CAU 1732 TaxID=3140358 RepID=UPI0032618271